jgi:biotin carboxyl carrier protein
MAEPDPKVDPDPTLDPDPKPDPKQLDATRTPEELAAEVEKWKSLSRQNEKQLRAAQTELEKSREASMSEQEKAVAAAKAEGAADATKATNERLVKAEVRAAAAGKLADPSIAVRLLDLSEFEVDANGDVDGKAIGKAIDALVKQYPALATTNGHGSGDGGARQGAPTDMNALIRSRMR